MCQFLGLPQRILIRKATAMPLALILEIILDCLCTGEITFQSDAFEIMIVYLWRFSPAENVAISFENRDKSWFG